MSEQADKLSTLIASLYRRNHLESMDTSQPFEPRWTEWGKSEILCLAMEDPEFIKPFVNGKGIFFAEKATEAALALVTDTDPMKGCDEYRRIAAEHDRDLMKDGDDVEKR